MTRQVFALLPASAHEPIVLAIEQGRGWQVLPAEDFRPESDDRAIGFAPATCVTHHRAHVSARSEKEALLSVPYLVEDDLAQPVELLHVALGRRAPDQLQRDLYVVDFRILEAWIDQLKQLGLRDAKIVPELALLPAGPVLVDLGARCLVALRERRYGVDLTLPDDLVHALIAPDGEKLPTEPLDGHPLLKLVSMLAGEPPADLRQGPFAVRAPGFNLDLQSLRMPLSLAAACVIASLGFVVAETSALKNDASRLKAEAARQYASLFPEEGSVADPELRIRAKAASVGQSALDFRTAVAALYRAVLSVDGTEIRSIRYERAQGVLRATLSYGAYGDDSKVSQFLSDAGLQVGIGDSRQEQERVIGDLTLEQQR
jgi:type II secretion system protein L